MKNKVTLNKGKLKELFASVIFQKLQERDGELNHTNHDAYYTPSRWYYDTAEPSLGGYILGTSGSVTTSKDSNDKITVQVHLQYDKNIRS